MTRERTEHDAAHAWLVGLLRDREQRLLERQRRFHQCGELTGHQREIRRGKTAVQAESQRLVRAGGLSFLDLGDGDRKQALVAQELPHVSRCVPLDDALAFAAGGVDRDVFERPHPGTSDLILAWTRPHTMLDAAAKRGAKCIRFLSLRG